MKDKTDWTARPITESMNTNSDTSEPTVWINDHLPPIPLAPTHKTQSFFSLENGGDKKWQEARQRRKRVGVRNGKWLKKCDQGPKGEKRLNYEAAAENCIKAPNGVHSFKVICGNVFIPVKHG